tara:strand:- start:365 stop:565 length:201 start_codon:yes stop_codon:yes gene_type:complete
MANSIVDVIRYDPKWDVNANGMRFNLEQMIELYVFQKMEQHRVINNGWVREKRYQANKTYQESNYH